MSLINKVVKNTGIIVVGNIFFKLISLVVTIYLARYLGVADFGMFNFLFAYLSFFVLISDLGLQTVLVREIAQNKNKTPELIGSAIIMSVLLSILAFILAISIITLMSFPSDTILYVYIISISIFFISFSDVYTSIFNANLKMEYDFYARITYRIISALFIFLIIFLDGNLLHIVVMMVVSEFIKLIFNYYYSKKLVIPIFKIDIEMIKYLLRASFPVALTGFFGVVYHNIDIIMLSQMKGDLSIGYYSAALKLIGPLGLIPLAMMTSLFPVVSLYAHESKEKLNYVYSLSSKYSLLISLPIAIGVSFLSKNIILIIFGNEFIPSSSALIILIWAQSFIFLNVINGNILISLHKQMLIAKVVFFGAILNVILNFILIPKFDFYGASVATVATEGFILMSLIFVLNKYIPIPLINITTLKIFITNIILSIYLLLIIDKLNIYIIILTSGLLYIGFYYLIGGLDEDDVKLLKKIFHR